jgi:hypothetical protein
MDPIRRVKPFAKMMRKAVLRPLSFYVGPSRRDEGFPVCPSGAAAAFDSPEWGARSRIAIEIFFAADAGLANALLAPPPESAAEDDLCSPEQALISRSVLTIS